MSEYKSAVEILGDMGFNANQVLSHERANDKRVCRCGHAMTRHDSDGLCASGISRVMTCHCQGDNLKAVFVAEDLECFRYSDFGSGQYHALTKGIARLATKGKGGFWAVDAYECTVAGCENQDKLVPVVLDMYHVSGTPKVVDILNKKMNAGPYAGWKDHFLCPAHYEQLSENYEG